MGLAVGSPVTELNRQGRWAFEVHKPIKVTETNAVVRGVDLVTTRVVVRSEQSLGTGSDPVALGHDSLTHALHVGDGLGDVGINEHHDAP